MPVMRFLQEAISVSYTHLDVYKRQGTSAVTQPLENLKTLIIAVIGAVGVIILARCV